MFRILAGGRSELVYLVERTSTEASQEIVLWLTSILTETYAMEKFKLKDMILGAFASCVAILLLPSTERAGIVPLTRSNGKRATTQH